MTFRPAHQKEHENLGTHVRPPRTPVVSIAIGQSRKHFKNLYVSVPKDQYALSTETNEMSEQSWLTCGASYAAELQLP